jgi:hypothetical protein
MKKMPAAVLAVALMFGAACSYGTSGGTPAPVSLDPVGTYTFETSFDGQAITGEIIITGSKGAYGGSVEPDVGPPPVPITEVTVSGWEITLTADAGGEVLIIVMTFTGNSYTGSWALGLDSGELKGEKVEP